MKSHHFFSILLIFSLLFSLLCLPASAEAAQSAKTAASDSGGDAQETTETTETTETAVSADALSYDPETGFPAIDGFSVNGTAALLLDLDTGTILYSLNLDKKVYPASLTKLMTCLVAVENGSLDDTVTVTASALQGVDPDGTKADLQIGETLRLEDLLYCMMLSSANEASNVIAEHIAGSVSGFITMMNEKAAALGCTGTNFTNAHGLHDDNHYTTVRDLLKITEAALANETVQELCYATKYEVPATNLSEARTLYTTNYLISTDQSYKYYYDKAKGVKTGYTSKAGRCLISTAESGKLQLLSIVMGCETKEDADGEYELGNFTETKSLFEYGFSNFDYVTVLSPMVPIAEVPVDGGEQASVVVAPAAEASFVLPNSYDSADVTTEVTLNGGSAVTAPVAAGDVVGSVSVYYRGKLMGSSDVTPITAVAAGSASFHSEAETAPETLPQAKISWPLVLLIVVCLLLGVYGFSYCYRNISRRKKRSKRRGGSR